MKKKKVVEHILKLSYFLLRIMFNTIRQLKDKRFKATTMYMLKPFLIITAIFISYLIFCLCSRFWLVFVDFSVFRLVITILLFLMIIPFFKVHIDFGTLLYLIAQVSLYLSNLKKGRVVAIEGEPGTGKTTIMHYNAYYLAQERWEDYKLLYHKLVYKYSKNDFETEQEKQRFKDFAEGYKFYRDNEYKAIPLLFENTPLKERDEFGGRYCYKVDYEHFIQSKRLPESAVIAYDEAADTFSNKRSDEGKKQTVDIVNDLGLKQKIKNKLFEENKLIDEFLSKERHFLDAYMYFAEQDSQENFIGIRRITSSNKRMLGIEFAFEPVRYYKKIDKLVYKIARKNYVNARDSLYAKLIKLEEKCSKIGFLVLHYEERGNVEKSRKIVSDGIIVIPKYLPYEFETRSYYFDYKARKQVIACDIWTVLYK